jgi:hypothetical protein
VAPDDEFFVGYLNPVPRGIVRAVKMVVLVLIAISLGVAAVGAALEKSPGNAVWDDAPVIRAGMFVANPYPMLLTAPEHEGMPAQAVLLVNQGKCGALETGGFCGPMPKPGEPSREQLLAKFDHQMVEVTGTVLKRDGRAMIELSEGAASIRTAVGEKWREFPRGGVEVSTHGKITVRGMVVDSKCYAGAMKPGEGKGHRSCAVRCVSGGIPPVLVARDAAGKAVYFLLADAKGGACNEAVLPYMADEVEVSGELQRVGDLDVIAVSSITRAE